MGGVFASYTSVRGLTSGIYRENNKPSRKKKQNTNDPFKKMNFGEKEERKISQ